MASGHAESETSPLLGREDDTTKYLDPGHAPEGPSPAADGSAAPTDGPKPPDAEAAAPADVDAARAQQFEGMAEAQRRLKYTLPAMSIGIFLAAADQTIVASSYGTIGSDLRALNNTSWIATAFFLTVTAFQPLYGKLSDIFGRKPALLFAYAVFGLGCLWCGLARSMPELIAARALSGIGGGGMTTVVSIIMSDIVPLRERGLYQGLLNIIYATGSSTGAPLGGFLADLSWRWAFLGQAPLCLVAFIVVATTLQLPPPKAEHWASRLRRVDFAGSIVLVAAISLLLVGLDQGSNQAWSSPLVITCLAVSGPALIGFFLMESKLAVEPLAPQRIVFDRSLLAAYLCNFFSFAGFYFALFFVPLYFQAVRETSAARAGLWLLPAVAGGVVGSVGGGALMHKTGKYYWLTVAAYAILTVFSALTFLFLGVVFQSNVGISIGIGVSSFGNGIGVTTTLIALISNAAPEDQAVVTACSYLFRSLGSVLGLSITTAVVQQRLKTLLQLRLPSGEDSDRIARSVRESLDFVKTLPPDLQSVVRESYAASIRMGYAIVIGVVAMSLLCSFFIREKRISK